MSMRNPYALLPKRTSACSHISIAAKSTTSCWRRYRVASSQRLRSYATHSDATPDDTAAAAAATASTDSQYVSPSDPYYWPSPSLGSKTPTPYQILSIAPPTKTYIKTPRFYELVKLYHPDRTSHNSDPTKQIPQNVRLERYRLVVSAHALLSDPQKRRAYDLYGAGWSSAKSALPGPGFDMSPEAREACLHNATWQDWENWYQRFNPDGPPRKPQTPIFLSNAAFVSVVGILAVLAGVGQATRAKENSKTYVYMLDESSNRAKGEVNAVQADKQGWTREQRIDHFVKEREVDEELKRMIMNAEICESGQENEFNRRYR